MRKAILLLSIFLAFTAANSVQNFYNQLLGRHQTKLLGSTTVLASCFDDQTGMRDNNLYDGYNYAELSNDYTALDFSALGGLSFGYQLRITYNGNSVVASKGDVGAGGPNHPKIDIHIHTLQALGVSDCDSFLANVEIDYLG